MLFKQNELAAVASSENQPHLLPVLFMARTEAGREFVTAPIRAGKCVDLITLSGATGLDQRNCLDPEMFLEKIIVQYGADFVEFSIPPARLNQAPAGDMQQLILSAPILAGLTPDSKSVHNEVITKLHFIREDGLFIVMNFKVHMTVNIETGELNSCISIDPRSVQAIGRSAELSPGYIKILSNPTDIGFVVRGKYARLDAPQE